MSEAFTAGVNAFIREGALPAEYRFLVCSPEPWHPRDGSAWGAVLAWGLSVNWQTELLRLRLVEQLGPERAADLAPTCMPGYQTILPETEAGARLGGALLEAFHDAARQLPLGEIAAAIPAGSGLGSNNWVVSGAWTRSGRPALANDPHLPPIFPTLWYENHLAGGRYDVTGFTTPGVPGVIIGHNRHIAWGITNGFPDVQDLFVEQFHETDPLLYARQGEWRQATVEEEVIHVRGRRRPLVQHVRYTHHGPIISDLLAAEQQANGASPPRHALALRWASHDENNHLRTLLGICRAANWDDFRRAAQEWAFPPQNIVYADTGGNIGYLLPGRIPRRNKGDGLVPAPGWNGDYDWQGWIAPDELPSLFNPQQGYIVTANNQVTGDDYPCLLTGEWLAPYRAQRITSLLEKLAPLDIGDHVRIQTDIHSIPTRRFVQLALDILDKSAGSDLTQAARNAISRLRGWDGAMKAAAVEPALAFGWQLHFTRAAICQALGPQLGNELLNATGPDEVPLHPFHEIAHELALRWLQDGPPHWVGPVASLLPQALEQTVAALISELGDDPDTWQWGRLHYVELHSYLARIPGLGRLWKPLTYPLGGDGYSVSQARVAPHFPPGPAHVIASCRFIADVGNWDDSISTLPGGQSGHPASDHYQDSVEDWLHGNYHPMLFSRSRVEQEAKNRLVLQPAPEQGSPA